MSIDAYFDEKKVTERWVVIASLWRVDDESTKELFVKFYSNKKGGMVEGIKQAELSLMEKHGFYHWAPFQIYGI